MNIDDLANAIRTGAVLITDHADEESESDGLSFDEVYFSVEHGEIIEEYPATSHTRAVWSMERHLERNWFTAFGRTMIGQWSQC